MGKLPTDEEITIQLPPAFRRSLEGIISVSAMRALIGEFGGRCLYVPCLPPEDPENPLVRILPHRDLVALCHHAAGESLDIPIGAAMQHAETANEIRRLAEQGLSQTAIAKRLRLTRRWVSEILRRHVPKP